MARRDLTKAAELLGGKRETNPLSHTPPLRQWNSVRQAQPNPPKPAPVLDPAVSRRDETTRDKVPVSLSHTPLGVRQMRHPEKQDEKDAGETLEARLIRLVADGAIDADDAALIRRRFHAYANEWMFLLDCCERARQTVARKD